MKSNGIAFRHLSKCDFFIYLSLWVECSLNGSHSILALRPQIQAIASLGELFFGWNKIRIHGGRFGDEDRRSRNSGVCLKIVLAICISQFVVYFAFVQTKFSINCNAYFTESIFKTRFRNSPSCYLNCIIKSIIRVSLKFQN